jgi:LCP family protein required for cell wall assembly
MADGPIAPPRGRAANRRRGATDSGAAPRGGRAAQSRAAARKAQRKRRGRVLKIVALVVAGLVAVGVVGVVYLYNELSGNLHTDDINSKTAGTEKKDAFGRSPINILVIGSDSRSDKADCKLGGDCQAGGGQRADVEMVVHISADRSNATVMSIPRDLETSLPACDNTKTGAQLVGPRTNMINSALDYGPDCQVATVHHLTGIPIDHFVEVDFSGVVSMSDAVGGVSVCVDNNVYDPQSHLKLSKGTHTLMGVAALEFVRTRHGFGDGSDNVGRTSGQHAFLAATMAKMKDAGTLTDPVKVVKLANAATKALTVDTGLGSISKLVALAQDFSKVPSNRVTFTTMQNYTDPEPGMGGRVLQGPGASTLFQTIANDQSLTTAGGKKSAAASATSTPVDKSSVAVDVENGTGTQGRASTILSTLTDGGFSSSSTAGNAPAPAATTTLTYPSGDAAQAKAVASTLGLPSSHVKQGTGSGIVLLVGSDWPSGTVFPGGHAAADTQKALNGALSSNGGKSGCVHVSTQDTITGGGTPEQAYANHPEVKNSAP